MGHGVWIGVDRPCPPVRNDIVTLRHLFYRSVQTMNYSLFAKVMNKSVEGYLSRNESVFYHEKKKRHINGKSMHNFP